MLTVMVTCYNQAAIIGATIDSLLKQNTSEHFKILISDDLSTDNSMDVLNEYANTYDNVRVIQPQTKLCVGNNRNNLLTNVDTDYCLFVDGDDVQEPNYIGAIIDEIKNSNKDIYRIKNFEETWSDRKVLKDSLNYSNFMLFVYKTKYIEGLLVNPHLKIGEDVEFEFRNYKMLHKEVNVIDACYALNRRDENSSLTKNGDIKKRYELELKLYEEIEDYGCIDSYVKAMVNRKKVELINLATLSGIKPDKYAVDTKNIGNKYLACYLMYKTMPTSLFKLILDKKIGSKF